MESDHRGDAIPPGLTLRLVFRPRCGPIRHIAWSPDGRLIALVSRDRAIQIFDAKSGQACQTVTLFSQAYGVAWAPDGESLFSGDTDGIAHIWNARTGVIKWADKGHLNSVRCMAWAPATDIVVGSARGLIQILTAGSNHLVAEFQAHSARVNTVMWSLSSPWQHRRVVASGSDDTTILLWDPKQGSAVKTLSGHKGPVLGLAWSADGRRLASVSSDRTMCIWDTETGKQTHILEGHTAPISSVAFSADQRLLASKSLDGTVRLWRSDTWDSFILTEPTNQREPGAIAFHPKNPTLASLGDDGTAIRIWDIDVNAFSRAKPATSTIQYVNAKVVLVGESGVGKSGLGIRMAERQFRPTESTHGAQFWQIPVSSETMPGAPDHVQAELTLWDLAGQADYHLVHQLFLDDTDVALLLFDCSDPADPFRGVSYWAKVLRKQAPAHAHKLLISARGDVSPVTVDSPTINGILGRYGLDEYVRTAAKTGEGIDYLMQRVVASVPWDRLPRTTTPRLFQVIREFLLERKEMGDTLISLATIGHEIGQRYTDRQVTIAEVDTMVGLLQSRGFVYLLKTAASQVFVLLKPEVINQYASSIIRASRKHPRGIGAVLERDALIADLDLTGVERLQAQEERTVLESTVELLIRHDLGFREMGLLVFPSQINITRPTPVEEHPPTEVTYQFSGSIEAIYASLVVRLSHTAYFHREDQWRYAVEFSRDGRRLGFCIRQIEEGTGELEVYFYPGVSEFDRVTFIRFITDHLRVKGINIQERIRLYCPHCRNEVENRDAIQTRVQMGKLDIPCQYCGSAVMIPRSIEERYRSDSAYGAKQQELADTVEKRTAQEVRQFQADHQQYMRETVNLVHILHISDLHLGSEKQARVYRTQLESDLRQELEIDRLEYLAVSGDIANRSIPEEYRAAFELFDGLVKRFGLDPGRAVIVPGNHDLNWDLSKQAYEFHYADTGVKLPDEGTYIPAGEAGWLACNDTKYPQRFSNFNDHFYKRVYSNLYPLASHEQVIVHPRPDDRVLFLAFNSSWEVDHHFRGRASINTEALTRALDQLQDGHYDDWLKIAVFHHPVTGREAMNDDFMQLLAVHGFQIVLHGHVHEVKEGFYKYDDKRGIHIIGAGTFGAPTREQMPGIPLQYNLLTFDPATRKLTVETRKKEKPDGAWMADARWEDKNNPSPRYTIQLK